MKKLSFFLALMLVFVFVSKAQTPGENIDVTHYEIYVWDFDFTNHTLQGEALVEFVPSVSISSIVLELKSLTVLDLY